MLRAVPLTRPHRAQCRVARAAWPSVTAAGPISSRTTLGDKAAQSTIVYYNKGQTSDMAHNEGTLSFPEYAYAATTTQLKSRSVRENMIFIPHSIKEEITLSEADKWMAAADKEMSSLKDLGV